MKRFLGLMLMMTFLLSACSPGLENPGTPTEPGPPSLTEKPPTETTEPVDPNVSPSDRLTSTAIALGITGENYPRIDGSTSTLEIVRAIHRTMFGNVRNVHYPEEASKTVPSYEKLIAGEVDLIIVPYASAEVLKQAEDKGVQLDFYPVAAEALVFITSKENPVDSITMEQVRSIYLDYGIRDWSSLGGSDRELVPIGRNADSGSQSQMDNLVLKDQEMHPLIQENHVELTMEGMLEQVAFYHNGGLDSRPTESYAMGYTLYTYLQNMTEVTGIGEHLKMLAFDGIAPTEESISDRSYSLSDGYYAVIRSDLEQDHIARRIVSWLTDKEGKTAVSDLGFIPME